MFIKKLNIVLLLAFLFVLLSCASAPRFTSERNKFTKSKMAKLSMISKKDSVHVSKNIHAIYNDAAVLETETGIASYYADAFNGKITYNGEVYNMHGISAAHQTYAMGTVLRVTILKNGKSIILRVNDRMPYNPDRIIDLSLGAAEELDMVHDGLVEVKIEVLKFGEGK